MNYYKESLKLHEENKGKIQVVSKVPLRTREDLSLAYTPGVAEPCLRIQRDEETAYRYTSKGNLVAVVTDGSAVLGLGNIGPKAALPVMEGKAVLFKELGNVDAFPICLNTQDTEEIIQTVKYISPSFGGINLEDIAAPRCFEIESRLIDELDIPVFHDDQHGTAVVAAAALINSLALAKKELTEVSLVIAGAGAAGTAIAHMLLSLGVPKILVCDSKGILSPDRADLTKYKQQLAQQTNPRCQRGGLAEAVSGADVFIGVSAPGILRPDHIRTMKPRPVIFAMANPEPEIMPDAAREAGAFIVGTGRSDFPNQINNTLVFPGLFQGALYAGARKITAGMKAAAAYALAGYLPFEALSRDLILPNPLEKAVASEIARAVAEAWLKEIKDY